MLDSSEVSLSKALTMETLIITVRDEAKRDQIEQVLRDLDGVERIQRIPTPDDVTLMAEPSLSEEWNSVEDQRWDSVL